LYFLAQYLNDIKELFGVSFMGQIIIGEDVFWGKQKVVGNVDAEGNVCLGEGWNEKKVGFVEPPRLFASGAALLLLIR
jgi:hypothetical protein